MSASGTEQIDIVDGDPIGPPGVADKYNIVTKMNLPDEEKAELHRIVDSMRIQAWLEQGRPLYTSKLQCELCFKPKKTHVKTPTSCGCELCPRQLCADKCHCSLCMGVGHCSICHTEVWRFTEDVRDKVFESVFEKNGCIACGLQFCDSCNATILQATHNRPIFQEDSKYCFFHRTD